MIIEPIPPPAGGAAAPGSLFRVRLRRRLRQRLRRGLVPWRHPCRTDSDRHIRTQQFKLFCTHQTFFRIRDNVTSNSAMVEGASFTKIAFQIPQVDLEFDAELGVLTLNGFAFMWG